MKKNLVFLFLIFSITTWAQLSIKSINIEGLKRTKINYIKLFINTKLGDDYDSLSVEKDRQRIENLEIIGEVILQKSKTDGGVAIVFICKEIINILPILSFGKTKDNFWIRTGLQDANLNGRANKLIAYYQNYDGHSVFIDYQISRIKKKPYGFSGTFIRWSTTEPYVSQNNLTTKFIYDNLNYGVSITRYLGFNKSLEFGINGFKENYKQSDYPPISSIPKSFQRDGGLIKSIFRTNHLNYNNFILNGYSLRLNTEIIKRISVSGVFFIAFTDLKYYYKLGKNGNFATRIRIGLSSNETTPFAPFVLDNYINIRGVGNKVDRGTGSIVFNAEYRHTLINYRLFATQFVSFIDFGSWRKPGGDFTDFSKSKNMQAFSGLGFRFIYKKAFDTMLRIDYGVDYNKAGGFVVGIGQYF